MERILRNLEFKENRCSETKRLWDDFCRSEQSDTTLTDNISISSSKPLQPILKNTKSTESIRTLSVTEIDSLILRANENNKRLYDEVQLIMKSVEPCPTEEVLESELTPRQSAEDNELYLSYEPTSERIQVTSDFNLNIGSESARSQTSAKIEHLSTFQFSHRSASNRDQPDDIHMYKLVLGDSNSSISENRSNQSTTRSVPTHKQRSTIKNTQPKKSPSKYNLLSAKEHLEMERILGIENLLKRASNTERPRLDSPDLQQIETALNINDIENVSCFKNIT